MEIVNRTLRDLRDVRKQTEQLIVTARRTSVEAALQREADTVTTKVGRLEAELTQANSKSGQDPIRFAGRIDNQWAELYGSLTGTNGYISGGAEGRPTRGAAERLVELNTHWARLSALWQEILTRDVPALNAAARALSIGGIVIPAPGAPIP